MGKQVNWSTEDIVGISYKLRELQDDLNRPMSINGVTCTSDILGNRLMTGGTSMTWDCLNRMTSLTNNLGTESYAYRADGMRVSKANGANGTTYRYDGQMAMEDVDTGSNPAVTDYAIGARGIDAISKTVGSNTTVVYPIYDAHGNMMADVSRNGSSFSINDKRSYDAWGNIRSGASAGDPKGRYCANLGHVQDDESNLIYMRARYYDPTSGRFFSEDHGRQGTNWFSYCQNCPNNMVDSTGNDSASDIISVTLSMLLMLWGSYGHESAMIIATAGCVMIAAWMGLSLSISQPSNLGFNMAGITLMTTGQLLSVCAWAIFKDIDLTKLAGVAGEATACAVAYISTIALFLTVMDFDS